MNLDSNHHLDENFLALALRVQSIIPISNLKLVQRLEEKYHILDFLIDSKMESPSMKLEICHSIDILKNIDTSEASLLKAKYQILCDKTICPDQTDASKSQQ